MSDDTRATLWQQTNLGSFIHAPSETIFWWVVKRWDGWYWHTSRRLIGGDFDRTSSEVGPFSNMAAAKADCEVAHR